MPTIEEAQQQIREQRERLSKARQIAQNVKQRELTRAELQKATLQSQIQRKVEGQKLQQQKTSALQRIQQQEQSFEKEAQKVETQIEQYKSQEQEAQKWKEAENLVKRKGVRAMYIAKGSDISSKVKAILEGSYSEKDIASASIGGVIRMPSGLYLDEQSIKKVDAPNTIITSTKAVELEWKEGNLKRKMQEATQRGEWQKYYDLQKELVDIKRLRSKIGGMAFVGGSISQQKKEPTFSEKFVPPKVLELFGNVKSGYQSTEQLLREKVTYPVSNYLASKGMTPEKTSNIIFGTGGTFNVAGISTPERRETLEKGELPKEDRAIIGFTEGYLGGLKEKPLKTATTTATFFVLPKVLKSVGKIPAVSWLASTPVGSLVGKTAKYGLPVLYGTSIFSRVSASPTTRGKGHALGEITSTEVVPMMVGTYTGTKFWSKTEGFFRTLGREEIPVQDIVPEEVLSGEKRFVESSAFGYKGYPAGQKKQKFDIKIFKKVGDTYHATPEQFWSDSFAVTEGSSEFKGLYVAPKISPYFLKVGGETSIYGGSFLEPYSTPAVAKVKGLKFTTTQTGQQGTAFVTGVKPEIEAVIQPETELYKIDTSSFFKWAGQKVPIDVFSTSASSGGVGSGITGAVLGSSYGQASPSYISTPSGLLTGLIISSSGKPSSSKPSSSISYSIPKPSSSASSIRSSSRIKPSYSVKPSSSISSLKSSISQISSSISPSSTSSSVKTSTSASWSSSKRKETYTPVTRRRTSSSKELIKRVAERLTGYRTWIKRAGKKEYLKGIAPRGKAIKKGAKRTRETLVATFGIEKAGETLEKDISFKPRKDIFRSFKIRGGAKIPLEDTWIQKAGTRKEGYTFGGARLGTRGEVSELMSFRKESKSKKKKNKKIKWFS